MATQLTSRFGSAAAGAAPAGDRVGKNRIVSIRESAPCVIVLWAGYWQASQSSPAPCSVVRGQPVAEVEGGSAPLTDASPRGRGRRAEGLSAFIQRGWIPFRLRSRVDFST